jgi:hypothetical protein
LLEGERRTRQRHVHSALMCTTSLTRTLGTKLVCCSAVTMTWWCCW